MSVAGRAAIFALVICVPLLACGSIVNADFDGWQNRRDDASVGPGSEKSDAHGDGPPGACGGCCRSTTCLFDNEVFGCAFVDIPCGSTERSCEAGSCETSPSVPSVVCEVGGVQRASCAAVCAAAGKTCSQGCWGDLAGYLSTSGNCKLSTPVAACEQAVAADPSASLACCCQN